MCKGKTEKGGRAAAPFALIGPAPLFAVAQELQQEHEQVDEVESRYDCCYAGADRDPAG